MHRNKSRDVRLESVMRTKADIGETDTAATKQAKLNRGRAVLSTCQMIFDVTGDLLADGRQIKQLGFDDGIVGLLGKLPILGRLVP
jgi:hypothetical protein